MLASCGRAPDWARLHLSLLTSCLLGTNASEYRVNRLTLLLLLNWTLLLHRHSKRKKRKTAATWVAVLAWKRSRRTSSRRRVGTSGLGFVGAGHGIARVGGLRLARFGAGRGGLGRIQSLFIADLRLAGVHRATTAALTVFLIAYQMFGVHCCVSLCATRGIARLRTILHPTRKLVKSNKKRPQNGSIGARHLFVDARPVLQEF